MSDAAPDIVIADRLIDPGVLRQLVERHFEDMVKFVVDVDRRVVAVGGELHADAAPASHQDALRALLLLRPAAARQLPLLLG
jgi:hypothetical protein